MKSIPVLYALNKAGFATREVTEGCDWVLDGEGFPTAKFDGVPCAVHNGILYKMSHRKLLKSCKSERIHTKESYHDLPEGSISGVETDLSYGVWPCWIPVDPVAGNDKPYTEAAESLGDLKDFLNCTAELCGPKIFKNAHRFKKHVIIPHGGVRLKDFKRSYDTIKEVLSNMAYEGIVFFTHDDTKMVKIRRKDFGLPWPLPDNEFFALRKISTKSIEGIDLIQAAATPQLKVTETATPPAPPASYKSMLEDVRHQNISEYGE